MNVPLDWRMDAHHDGALRVRDVQLNLGPRRVLRQVDLAAQPGRLLVLIGPNGAGKSSLLNLLAGLLRPDAGTVTLDGRALADWPPQELARRRALLSQQVTLDFAFDVDDVVRLGRGPRLARLPDADAACVEHALHAANAAYLRGRRYTELSGGEQRRVQFARVLAQLWDAPPGGTAWLLLDEPEAGLDIAHQHAILAQAVARTRQGWGAIAVLHDLNLAARYADDIALLAEGRVLRQGTAAQVLDDTLLSGAYSIALRSVAVGERRVVLAD